MNAAAMRISRPRRALPGRPALLSRFGSPSRHRYQRQLHYKGRPFAPALALSADRAGMTFHQRPQYRQPKPQPTEMFRALRKGRKSARPFVLAHPNARVRYAHRNLTPAGPRPYRDPPAFVAEFHRVLQNVPENLLDPDRVAKNFVVFRRQIQLECQPLLFNLVQHRRNRIVQDTMNVQFALVERNFAHG